MRDRERLIALADRVEKAGADEERAVLIDAYNAVFPHELMLGDDEKGDDETRYRRTMHRVRFTTFINAEAYVSAAMTLVPEGHGWTLTSKSTCIIGTVDTDAIWETAQAATPALALALAALRAHAAIAEKGEGR